MGVHLGDVQFAEVLDAIDLEMGNRRSGGDACCLCSKVVS